MLIFQERHNQIAFLKACLECSVYVSPTDPGLTFEELVEAGRSVQLQRGEISDALSQVSNVYGGVRGDRLLPNPNDAVMWLIFDNSVEPDYRNPSAFDFVFAQMRDSARAYGAQNAKLERTVIVERGDAQQIPRKDTQVAVTMLVMTAF
jgi:hypothetical protein